LCKHGIAALLELNIKIGLETDEIFGKSKKEVKKNAEEEALQTAIDLLERASKATELTTKTAAKTPAKTIPQTSNVKKEKPFPQPKQIKGIYLKDFSENHFTRSLPLYITKSVAELQKTGDLSYEILEPRKVMGEIMDSVTEPKSPPVLHKMYAYKAVSGTYNKNYDVACSCGQTDNIHGLCSHLLVLFKEIQKEWGDDGMEYISKFDDEKNALLAPYGYSLTDNLTGKFKFKINKNHTGRSYYYKINITPELIVLDKSIIKIADLTTKIAKHLPTIGVSPAERELKSNKSIQQAHIATADENAIYTYAVLPDLQTIGLSIYYVKLQYSNKTRTRFNAEAQIKIRPNSSFSLTDFKKLDASAIELLELSNKLSMMGISSFAAEIGERSLSDWTLNNASYENRLAIYGYIKQGIMELYQKFPAETGLIAVDNRLVIVNYMDTIKLSQFVTPTLYYDTTLNLRFRNREEGDFVVLEGEIYSEAWSRPINDPKASFHIPFTVILDDTDWYKLNLSPEQMSWFATFLQYKQIKVRKAYTQNLVRNMIVPMRRIFEMETNLAEPIKTLNTHAVPQLYLKELAQENTIIFHPIVQYDNIQVELNNEPMHYYIGEEEELEIKRDLGVEEAYKTLLQSLHPNFATQEFYYSNGCYFWLTVNEMLDKHWFVDFFQTLREQGIEIFGFNNLKKFKFNTNKAKFEMQASSGIDWFDMHAEMSFGDQVASLRDIQKALFKKQNYVQLADGTLGLLPEDWIEKYGTLLRIGSIKGDSLQVSKLHFTLLDKLYDKIDQETVLVELAEKREKLRNFNNITQTSTPFGIEATLRPYQKEGFNWLNFLDDFKWGGILADDMGLGKTLQVITFLQHKANLADAAKQPRKTHLIIAPTSLIFNWENEVEKFAPMLKTLIYHGPERKNLSISDFETVDMVITTYTTAAADIEKFKEYRFGYAILDESQAIKNAATQRYKAMRLLQSDNRLCMSGTPVENNTFDLYGQFNFLNPGMLGSMEYFKDQYATPIDKENDSEAAQELRRLVQPFMLRRTKELVADDLPEKTEIVLYCEMGSKQRKLYDAYREKVRKQVLGEIDAKGMSSAAMIILQGLLRLRQICDSPNLVNDDEITEFEEESIKLQELKEHIIERTGNHKILVFSQFKGMLALIRAMLEHAKIPFLYLDGGTSPKDRRTAVDKFQNDDKYRVFLISLKAGGTGLNLTAADYVYIVDPWWNPAVEAQAIDRTHRIGQKNHVFAYKMICKDTVEEKILKLQDKKKALAADLVASETGMMKSLTRDDIAFLFS
jgi:non-specific serine/threonine protein kinase